MAENGKRQGYRGWNGPVAVESIAGVGCMVVRGWEMYPDARQRSLLRSIEGNLSGTLTNPLKLV
jgi:hypothetical protein